MQSIKAIVILLLGLRILPFINAQLFVDAAARASRRRVFWAWGAAASVACNALTLLCADRAFFSPAPTGFRALLGRAHDLLSLNVSNQDIRALVFSSIVCMGLSFVYGLALQFALRGGINPRALRRRRALSMLLVALWTPVVLAGIHIAHHAPDRVRFTAFCRRTVAGMPMGQAASAKAGDGIEADGDGDSYISLCNDGEMDCVFDAFISTADRPRPFSLGRVAIPAHESRTCALRYGHDLRLDDSEETTVVLADGDREIDRQSVPALGDGEIYRKGPGDEGWRIYRYGKKDGEADPWTPVVSAPRFSLESGFYGEPFELSLRGPEGCRIFYTLDGSAPGEKKLEYTGPISIGDASLNENTNSMRTNVSAGFYEDRIRATSDLTPPGYRAPDFLVDKCTIVRAVCVDAGGNRSDVSARSYFVGFDRKTGYDGMSIVSIIMNPRDLFDYDRGIYVTGREYDEFLAGKAAGKTYRNDYYWWWWGANYRAKGVKTERYAWMELFDEQRRPVLSKQIGVRIQGGGSRGFIPRSLNLYARQKYDGSSTFGLALRESGFAPQRITLFGGADARVTKLDDYLMSRFVSDRAFATMAFKPCTLFLNGEYWGNYWLTEKYDEEYIGYYYSVDRDDIVMIKSSRLAEGEGPDKDLYTEMKDFISGSDMTVQENLDRACEMIDIDSFIDYYAAQAYISRTNDWPRGNFALWRTRSADGGGYSDGRWRWMLFDDNSGAFALALATEDSLPRIREKDAVFDSLMRNKALERRFIETLRDLAVNRFSPERVRAFIADYRAAMTDPLRKEYARFYGSGNTLYEDEFLPRVDEIEAFLLQRHDFILDYCDSYLAQNP